MFEKLGRAFREAYDNFKEELERDAVPETVDKLLKGMHDEAADTRAHIKRLEAEIEKTLKAADAHEKEAATCRRREKMALEIDDEETAKVAADYAEKHEKNYEVLGRKALALKEELDLHRAEFEQMLEAIKKAKADRATLTAQAGRSQARNSLSGADDLFAKLDALEEQMEGGDHQRAAEREVDEVLRDDDSEYHIRMDEDVPYRDREAEAEDRLEQLKRMMRDKD